MKTICIRMTAISLLVLVSSFALSYAQNREVNRQQAESVAAVLTTPDVQADLLTADLSGTFPKATLNPVYSKGVVARKEAKKSLEKKNFEVFPMAENGVDLSTQLGKLIAYPQCAIDNGVEGVVRVLCTVQKDGSVTDIKVIDDIGKNCANEVCRALREMKFKPALQNGFATRCTILIPVRFNLEW
jgi:TonB family protein